MNKFEFLVDKKENTLTVIREFQADRQSVWDCYTKQEFLDQWFAPKPFTTKTKSMDFSEGGHWHYAMVSPEGQEHWGYTEYFDVNPIDHYRTSDGFSDADGKINSDLPGAKWLVKFTEQGAKTTVTTVVNYNSLSDLETVINMGMEQGLKSTLEKLDELLVSHKVNK